MSGRPTYRGVVAAGQCDQMGHMNTQFYTVVFDQATALLFHDLGAPADRGGPQALGWADVAHSCQFRRELAVGDVFSVLSEVTGLGRSSVSYRHVLTRAHDGEAAAILDGKTVRFDLGRRTSAPLEAAFRARAEAALAARAGPPPGQQISS